MKYKENFFLFERKKNLNLPYFIENTEGNLLIKKVYFLLFVLSKE